MPVEVPKEPKKYTTVYDNFKGVDFTNDASNVYRRRSPTGVNMLPGLDGMPSKRTGWEVKISDADFITASGLVGVTTVSPDRTHHFSYGGEDYLMIFNSVGVFWIREGDEEVTLAELATGTTDSYTTSEFPPTGKFADANRAFFFEGNGTAGFYVFVENTLYRFGAADNGEMLFWEVEPTVPVFIIGAAPGTGVGTANQAINMLTDRRAIQYFGDGSTTDYVVPSAPDSEGNTKVELLLNGEWTEQTTGWSLASNNIVRFTSAPLASTVDNVRITYTPSDKTTYSLVPNTKTATAKIVAGHTIQRRRTRKRTVYQKWNSKTKKWVKEKNDTYTKPSSWETLGDERWYGSAKLSTPGISNKNTFVLKAKYDSSYVTETTYTPSWGAYNSAVTVVIPKNSIVDGLAKETETGGWAWDGGHEWKTETLTKDSITGKQTRSRTITTQQEQWQSFFQTKTYSVYGEYTKLVAQGPSYVSSEARDAFAECRKVLTFGNNIYNQVFLSASTRSNFRNRVWYCAANDPAYFPDTNYIEVGSDDKEVMGLIKVGSYLGVVKKGSGTEASIYLAYATSFEEETTYAVKQSVSGIGAISNGAFNILNEEPLFLSEHGVMGININETDVNRQVRNRSYYINKRLAAEENIENAISFVHGGMYYLAVNGHCYVLDGSQKSSWANEKTNLQYECYYLDNIPAQCFSKLGSHLYFTDNEGSLCRFKNKNDTSAYVDDYLVGEADWIATEPPTNDLIGFNDFGGASDEYAYLTNSDDDHLCVYNDLSTEYKSTETYSVDDIVSYDEDGEGITREYVCVEDIETPEEWTPAHWGEQGPIRLMVMDGHPGVNATVSYMRDYYTVIDTYTDEYTGDGYAVVSSGVPIYAEWSTIADDDEMVHFFKNLNKKGCVVSLLPGEGSYVRVLIKPDEKEPKDLGYIQSGATELPADLIVKKKIKKYKRLQFIVRDDWYNDGFALDQIIKTYTVGNYSKNRK